MNILAKAKVIAFTCDITELKRVCDIPLKGHEGIIITEGQRRVGFHERGDVKAGGDGGSVASLAMGRS